MITPFASKVILSDKKYCNITTNVFQEYIDKNFKGKLLWKAMKIDFKNWTKENWNVLNGKTWSTITRFWILCAVWIKDHDNNNSQSKLLMKLVLATKYNIDLKN